MMTRKKILFVLGNMNQGGAERQSVYLAEWLRSNTTHELRFISFSGPGRVNEKLDKLGIPHTVIPFNFHFIDHFGALGMNRHSLKYFRELKREKNSYAEKLKQFSPDVLMPFTYYPNVVCGLARKNSGAKICIWNQRDIGLEGMTGSYPEKLAVKGTTHFVSNSTQGAAFMKEKLNIADANLRVIHNGIVIPGNETGKNAEEFHLPENYFRVVMLANFHPNKDHDTLVRAWKKVVDACADRKPQLICAGKFGGTESKLRVLAKELNIENEIIFLDSVKDVDGLLRICDLCVHSSRLEGNPNAVMEAMAAGLPVVATDIEGCREVLGNDYPYLCKAGDAEQMSSLILKFISDEKPGKKVGGQNKKRIESDFSIDKMGKSYLELIEAK
ncbi:MAG: glycosyltransferase [Bacteroidetes bacterium]|nr:glycosyltransferase [Bacteroidota bacterium]